MTKKRIVTFDDLPEGIEVPEIFQAIVEQGKARETFPKEGKPMSSATYMRFANRWGPNDGVSLRWNDHTIRSGYLPRDVGDFLWDIGVRSVGRYDAGIRWNENAVRNGNAYGESTTQWDYQTEREGNVWRANISAAINSQTRVIGGVHLQEHDPSPGSKIIINTRVVPKEGKLVGHADRLNDRTQDDRLIVEDLTDQAQMEALYTKGVESCRRMIDATGIEKALGMPVRVIHWRDAK